MTEAAAFPTLTRIDGRFHWRFDDGTTLLAVSGGDGDTLTAVPADLTTIEDDAEIEALLAQQQAEFDRLHDEGSRDLPTLTALADDIDRLRQEGVRRETAAAEADAELARLHERVHGTSAETPEEPEQPEQPDEEQPDAETQEAVTAAARRPRLENVRQRAPRPAAPAARPNISITAAAGLPNVNPGATIELAQVAQSMHDVALRLNDGDKPVQVATVNVPYDHNLTTDPAQNAGVIASLLDSRPHDAAGLVASGGWCAPSVPLWELFDLGPSTNNLFDVPTAGAGGVRAGIMVPTFYDYTSAAGALWTWTEANDIAAADTVTPGDNPSKPCMKVPCPTWTEARLEAEGLCVTHGNLQDRAWPELTRQFLSLVMGAHARRLSAAKIAKVIAGATAVTPAAGMLPSDALGDLVNVIALAAADLRSQYRVDEGRAVTVILPEWIKEVLRSTLAMRAGVEAWNVTDAEVTAALTSRGVRPQFTPDWQALYSAAPATAWPANVTFVMYFEGAYISLDGGSIDLGVQRDSTLNKTNDFTLAWSEQFYQVVRRGPLARSYTVPLTVNGKTGGDGA